MSDAPIFGIVIPTLNAEPNIERLLTSIRAQSLSSYSIAIVDECSDDRTPEIATSYGCIVVTVPRRAFYAPPGRNRNLGVAAIKGHVLLHLDADMELASTDFLKRLQELIDDDHQAAIIRECDVGFGFWSGCKALERRCYQGTRLEAARAVTRSLFVEVGGYDEDVTSGEDLYVSGLYERRTGLIRDDSIVVRHHIGNLSLGSMLQKKFSYGRAAVPYLGQVRKTGGWSGPAIARECVKAYLRNWRLIRTQPLQYVSIVPMRMLEFAALSIGMLISRSGMKGNPPSASSNSGGEGRSRDGTLLDPTSEVTSDRKTLRAKSRAKGPLG